MKTDTVRIPGTLTPLTPSNNSGGRSAYDEPIPTGPNPFDVPSQEPNPIPALDVGESVLDGILGGGKR